MKHIKYLIEYICNLIKKYEVLLFFAEQNQDYTMQREIIEFLAELETIKKQLDQICFE